MVVLMVKNFLLILTLAWGVVGAYEYDDGLPTLTSVSPSSDTAGAELLFIGSNLVSVGTVKLDTFGITLVHISETQDTIYTTIPDSIPVGVYTPIIQWSGGADSIVDGFEVVEPVSVITSVSPSNPRLLQDCRIGGAASTDSIFFNSVYMDSTVSSNDTSKTVYVRGITRGLFWLIAANSAGRDSLRVRVKDLSGSVGVSQ
jgi:hypothetical protein